MRFATFVAIALTLLPAYGQRFESDVKALVEGDARLGTPERGILFIGSSIFRRWTDLKTQMAPLPVYNHAFGGSQTQDILDRADQLVFPLQPRVIVYYCGSNDVNAGASASQILARTTQFLDLVDQRAPGTIVVYTGIQKAPDKRAHWDVVDAVNSSMERLAHTRKNLQYVDLNPVLFKGGALREDLFLPDQLHFRPESSAYAEFAAVVKPVITAIWREVQK